MGRSLLVYRFFDFLSGLFFEIEIEIEAFLSFAALYKRRSSYSKHAACGRSVDRHERLKTSIDVIAES
jgi:ribosomal 50S subunit-recycling heat shock protein